MTTSTYVEPSFRWLQYKGRVFAESRGLWEVENDYMGGPFVCHTYLDKEQKNVIVMEGFVYAPKFDKRAQEIGQKGGYTTIHRLAIRRGDAAEMALIEILPL